MRTWSDSPFPPVVDLAGVPQGRVLGTQQGESRIVYEIGAHPGWVAKIYKHPLSDAAAADLQRLVYLPTLLSQQEQDLVDSSIAWPVSRITEGGAVVGVVMAKAPETFFARRKQKFSGTFTEAKPVELDLMVTGDAYCRQIGIAPADRHIRARAMRDLLAVGTLFARQRIVYADWSYSNAFWQPGTGAVFVIDMDTCGFGERKWIQTAGWEDPLFNEHDKPPLTVLSDRYKLAVLTVRCLTGVRQDPMTAHRELAAKIGPCSLTTILQRALTVTSAADRPSPQDIATALEQRLNPGAAVPPPSPAADRPVSGGNVKGGTPVGRGAASAPSAGSAAATATPAAARNPAGVENWIDLSARVPKPATTRRTPASAPVPTPAAAPAPRPAPTPAVAPVPAPARRLLTPFRFGVLLAVTAYLVAHLALGWF